MLQNLDFAAVWSWSKLLSESEARKIVRCRGANVTVRQANFSCKAQSVRGKFSTAARILDIYPTPVTNPL